MTTRLFKIGDAISQLLNVALLPNTSTAVLGDLPTKTGAWPLVVKIKEQAEAQVASTHEPVGGTD